METIFRGSVIHELLGGLVDRKRLVKAIQMQKGSLQGLMQVLLDTDVSQHLACDSGCDS